jgi:hypothetical protein
MNRTHRLAASALAATIALGTIGLTASAASAQDGTAVAKRTVEAKIDARLAQLAQLQHQVDASKNLTDGDRSALGTILSNEVSGLTQLRANVDAATDTKTIADDARSMIDDYRVYVVVTPQVHLTIATDAGEHAVEVANDKIAPKLDAAIAQAKANGKDVAKAQADDDAFKAAVAAAAADLDGQSATLLAQVPHGYPANHQTFLDARAKIADARAKLAEARTDAHNVVDDLKSA